MQIFHYTIIGDKFSVLDPVPEVLFSSEGSFLIGIPLRPDCIVVVPSKCSLKRCFSKFLTYKTNLFVDAIHAMCVTFREKG